MYFLIDNEKKILFGWSAKCGCSHIKTIFKFLQNNNLDNKIHTIDEINGLPNNVKEYITIIISRNPYKRLISGFLDKYNNNSEFRHLWKHNKITFSMFIDELINKNWEMIDKHHFIPQTEEEFNMKIMTSKVIKFYDIENIDYKYIEQIYGKKIPEALYDKKYKNERPKNNIIYNNYVYDIDLNEYFNFDVDIKFFYNEDLKNKVYNFYKNDFDFFMSNGIDYKKFL